MGLSASFPLLIAILVFPSIIHARPAPLDKAACEITDPAGPFCGEISRLAADWRSCDQLHRRPARAGPQRTVRRLDARVHGEDAAHRAGAEHEKIHGR